MELKLKKGQFELSLAGEFDEVKQMFELIHEKVPISAVDEICYDSSATFVGSQISEVNRIPTYRAELVNDVPELIQLIKSGKDFSEKNWILIYAYYLSMEQDDFNETELRTKYITDRNTSSNASNFSNNFKANIGVEFKYIKDRIVLTDKGRENAEKLILGGKTDLSKSKKAKSKTATKRNINKVNLDIPVESLAPFIEKFKHINIKSDSDRLVALMYLYRAETKIDTFNVDLLGALFDLVGLPIPKHLSQMLINLYNDKKLDKLEKGIYKIKLSFEPELKKIMESTTTENA